MLTVTSQISSVVGIPRPERNRLYRNHWVTNASSEFVLVCPFPPSYQVLELHGQTPSTHDRGNIIISVQLSLNGHRSHGPDVQKRIQYG